MTEDRTFILGTRGSPLALWQAERVKTLLAEAQPGCNVKIEIIHTIGDKILDKPLVQVGGKGIFTKEIENALLDKSIDFAVHSFKDLPTMLPEGLGVTAIPERDSPFDALISRRYSSLLEMPEAPVIATGSLRRRAQVLALRPNAQVIDLRGNVNTRFQKYNDADWDGMIMAHAAIRRMEWEDRIAGVIQPGEMLPAPAQGAIAIESRIDDEETRTLLQSIHDAETAISVMAERSFLATLEGGCQAPMAAYATVKDGLVTLEGMTSALDGKPMLRESKQAPCKDAEALGRELAQSLLDQGADEIIETLKSLNQKS
ncbi:MAG: hydroxymethylbilane synthase [Candidatus Hinthialibacter antarcticus]|nr:hydroxymethylbilane synthase [Candidatus Hinthialibacter antarcticus]